MSYEFSLVCLSDVDNMSKGGDDIDINTSKWDYKYPSSEMVFWNDISTI